MSYEAVEEVLLALQEGGLIEGFNVEPINNPTCKRIRNMSWIIPGRELEVIAGGLHLMVDFPGAADCSLIEATEEMFKKALPLRHKPELT